MGNRGLCAVTVLCLAMARPVVGQSPPITLSIVPIGGNEVNGATVVTLEVFVTVDADTCLGEPPGPTNPNGVRLESGQVDLPCALPGGSAGSISIVDPGGLGGATTDPDGDGARGPSSGGIEFVFGAAGLGLFQPSSCVVATTPPIGTFGVNLNVGQTRYVGTYYYQVSNCAVGDFDAILEGITHPPLSTNTTRFREDCPAAPAQGLLVDLNGLNAVLTVPEGQCCMGGVCLGLFNEHCCLADQGGELWTESRTCADPCPCLEVADCDDDNLCTTDDCVLGECQNDPNTLGCNDGLFCTLTDACAGGLCVGGGDRCPGQLCNENQNTCVQCLTSADCASDGNPCTQEVCNPGGHCQSIPDDSQPCDDGQFCTQSDACSGGACLGKPGFCVPGETCCENVDACRECCTDANCADPNPCTVDLCEEPAGVCSNTVVTGGCDDGDECTRDDSCSTGFCIGEPYCQLFGDVVDVAAEPRPDCQVDVSDLLCVLDDFLDPTTCPGDGDLISADFSCVPDGIIDSTDLLAELDAFSGFYGCSHPCPP